MLTGDRLTALLRDHILTAAELLAAAKADDSTKMGNASRRWYANTDEIAAFLNGANPRHWPLAEMRAMMRRHLDLTLEEASARLKGDWAADIAAYDNSGASAVQEASAVERMRCGSSLHC